MVNSSILRHKIIFKKRIVKTDGYGRKQEEYINSFKTYAYVNNLSGKEYWSAFEVKAENTIVFEMRYNRFFDNLRSTEYVIEFNNNIYDIAFIDNIQYKNKTLKIKGVLKDGWYRFKGWNNKIC